MKKGIITRQQLSWTGSSRNYSRQLRTVIGTEARPKKKKASGEARGHGSGHYPMDCGSLCILVS